MRNPTINSTPQFDASQHMWYDSLEITLHVENKENGTDANDSMTDQAIKFLVPDQINAEVNVFFGVDDWGKLRIVEDETGVEKLVLSLTSNDDKPGPRTGHAYWYKNGTVSLSSGKYTIYVEQQNVTYPPQYDRKYNVSRCNVTLHAVAGKKSLKVLSADKFGEIGETGTDCSAYIKTGDVLDNKGNHAISVGLEYREEEPDPKFDGTPKSTRNTGVSELDHFAPKTVPSPKGGTTQFKVWSEHTAPDGIADPPKITLNGTSSSISFKNAVFADLFEVTVYYTIKESGCKEGGLQSVKCHIGDINNPVTVTIKNIKQDFLLHLTEEGFGKFQIPYSDSKGNEYSYIAPVKGKGYYISQQPLGNYDNKLIDKVSCAVDKSLFNSTPKRSSKIKIILDPDTAKAFGNLEFIASDVGDKVKAHHIDLYWGEDNPSPKSYALPAGLPNGIPDQGFRVILIEG